MPTAPTVVKVGSPGDIAAAVPHLLGFVPYESVVVVTLHGDRRRIGLTLRLDLLPRQHDGQVAAMLAARAMHEKPQEVFVLVFTALPDVDGLVGNELVAAVEAALDVPIADAILVRDGRWWSYLCHEERCCPSEGTPLDPQSPGALALAAAHALNGRSVLADRETVVDSLMPLADGAAELVEAAVDRSVERVVRSATRRRQRRAAALMDTLLARYVDPRANVEPDEAAYLLVACRFDLLARDEVLRRVVAEPPPGGDDHVGVDRADIAVRVLRDIARRAPSVVDVSAWAMLAFAAYCAGDGVVASAALDRALAIEPEYSLAGLLSDALERQVPPNALSAAWREG